MKKINLFFLLLSLGGCVPQHQVTTTTYTEPVSTSTTYASPTSSTTITEPAVVQKTVTTETDNNY
jgi:hypothetical protein